MLYNVEELTKRVEEVREQLEAMSREDRFLAYTTAVESLATDLDDFLSVLSDEELVGGIKTEDLGVELKESVQDIRDSVRSLLAMDEVIFGREET